MSTDDPTTDIRARLEAATEGPWFYDSYSRVYSAPWVRKHDRVEDAIPDDTPDDDPRWGEIPDPTVCEVPVVAGDTATPQGYHDATLIAHAPTDLAWALAEITRLRRALDDHAMTLRAERQEVDRLGEEVRRLRRVTGVHRG